MPWLRIGCLFTGFWRCIMAANDIFKRQKEFLKEIQNQIIVVLETTINSFGFVLKDFVVNKQLFREGIDGNGQKLEGYTRTTIRLKIKKGDPADRTTLRDEGDFYESIKIEAFSDRFEVSSDVNHDKYIVKRYGRDVLKITDANLREFMMKYFLPNLKQKINVKFTK